MHVQVPTSNICKQSSYFALAFFIHVHHALAVGEAAERDRKAAGWYLIRYTLDGFVSYAHVKTFAIVFGD